MTLDPRNDPTAPGGAMEQCAKKDRRIKELEEDREYLWRLLPDDLVPAWQDYLESKRGGRESGRATDVDRSPPTAGPGRTDSKPSEPGAAANPAAPSRMLYLGEWWVRETDYLALEAELAGIKDILSEARSERESLYQVVDRKTLEAEHLASLNENKNTTIDTLKARVRELEAK